jgi:uncharacterized protein (DUF2235 family)
VLLSDGTGNSSAKLMKTNVWRMYEAVDLTTGDQIACYDNGVGTSSFKPIAVLGGALGWGLKRNVRHLYTYACSHYVLASGDCPADRLYGFGFSRGSFTMRVLMGLIESQGLVCARGRELDRLAKWAYREYRRKFNATRGLVTPLRFVRDVALRAWERLLGRTPYSQATRVRPEVAFMGLWDTVDAYGLPIDEMTRGWDQWVWPLSMCEHARPSNVSKICHALAVDDERHTFHPVLLDERHEEPVDAGKKPVDHTDQERVTQVWFAGVHSNVGGGYPDDALAHVSLLWMAAEAAKKGLRLHSQVRDLWIARADASGPTSDSRRGLGAYYRYNPRSIKKLTDDRFADVVIKRPKIHESVFQRIVAARDDYAPIVLPERYDIVTSTGAIVDNSRNPYEHATQSSARCADQERVWNLVWLRRVLYFSTVGVTLVILLAPFLFKERILGDVDLRSGSITDAVHLLGAFLPSMLQPIATYWEGHPVIFAALAVALAVLFGLSTIVQRSIADSMRKLWDGILRDGPREVGPGSAPTDLVYRIRSHPVYRGTADFMSQHVFPLLFGVAALAAVVLIVVGSANRAVFSVMSAVGVTCPSAAEMNRTGPAEWDGIKFHNKEICQPTGVMMERGHTYEVSIALPDDWADDGHRAGLAGLGTSENPLFYIPALPFRRVLREAWFVPVARIGRRSPEYYPLTKAVTEITPRRSGHVYLFVNQAIGIPPWHQYFYKSHEGGPATVKVTERTAAPPSSTLTAASSRAPARP